MEWTKGGGGGTLGVCIGGGKRRRVGGEEERRGSSVSQTLHSKTLFGGGINRCFATLDATLPHARIMEETAGSA